MNLPAALFAIRWLIRDTFRQSLASGIFWLMLGVSAVCVALCASVTVVGDVDLDPGGPGGREALPRSELAGAARAVAALVPMGAAQGHGVWPIPAPLHSPEFRQVDAALRQGVPLVQGRLEMAFGAVRVDITRDRALAVRTLEMHLAGWVADTAGVLLALMWTAGFLPSFLEPQAVAVLLTKPVPRWSLLAGKYIGVLVFVALQAVVFVGTTWLTLALRTGVWDPTYLLCIPLLIVEFGTFFSFSAVLAVATRSTVACVFGSILFWLVCWGMNFGRHATVLLTDTEGLSPAFGHLVEAGYWVLPKPLDFHLILVNALGAQDLFAQVVDTQRLAERGAWSPEMSVLASVLCAVVLTAVAAYDFVTTDY